MTYGRGEADDALAAIAGGAVSFMTTVNVGLQPGSEGLHEPDPRHRAFYEIWEGMLGLADQEEPTAADALISLGLPLATAIMACGVPVTRYAEGRR